MSRGINSSSLIEDRVAGDCLDSNEKVANVCGVPNAEAPNFWQAHFVAFEYVDEGRRGDVRLLHRADHVIHSLIERHLEFAYRCRDDTCDRPYLTHLYERLPLATTAADLEALLPWTVKPLLKAAAASNT